MKRSGWVTGAVVAHLLFGLLLLGTCAFLLSLIRSPEVKQGKDPAEVIGGLKLSAGIIGSLALLVLFGAYSLWKNRLWGWWLALITDLGLLFVFVYSMIDDGWRNLDPDMFGITTATAGLGTLLLLPPVRRFYWRTPVLGLDPKDGAASSCG